MKRILPFLCLIFLFPSYALGVSLSDYVIPESFSRDFYLNGNFNFNSGNQPQSSYDGFLSANYKSRYSSVPRVWSIKADGLYQLEKVSTEGASSDDAYNLTASTTLDNYLGESDVFIYGGLDLGYRKSMGTNSADDPFSQVQIGAGYGRVYDATPLAQAMRIVDDLIDYRVLNRELSDEAYLKLAQVIDREDEYKSKYSPAEYKKYWYEDIAKVLIEDGALSEPELSPLGVIRIQEILDEERFSTRNHGWLVRAGVGYIISNYVSDADEDPTLNAAFEYYLPLSYKLQFNEVFQYTTILDNKLTHNISNALSLTYEMSNEIDWENSYILSLTMPTEKDLKDKVTNTFSSAFYYYLTNTLSASATFSLTHFEDNVDDNGNDDVETKIFIGFRYRLL